MLEGWVCAEETGAASALLMMDFTLHRDWSIMLAIEQVLKITVLLSCPCISSPNITLSLKHSAFGNCK
jgi:hypothetical protein